jgi:SAM-dependent methyltransferase
MRPEALAVLRCPGCGGELEAEARALRCGCGARYRIEETGVVRLLPATRSESAAERRTRRAFEIEWRVFGSRDRLYGGTAAESMGLLFAEIDRPDLGPEWVRGKRVLDVGCGHGRYVAGLAELGAEAFGLDLGAGIHVAARHCSSRRVTLVQGDLFAAPFAPGSFDFVFSKGVVHCTPDPRGAVRCLARLVRPGGLLFVWVYPRYPLWFRASQEAVRQLTKRLPAPVLLPLCFAAAPFLGPLLRYGLRVPTHAASPQRSFDRTTWGERAQMIYDWLSPWHQSYHDPEEVCDWLEENGFGAIRRSRIPSGASGRKYESRRSSDDGSRFGSSR